MSNRRGTSAQVRPNALLVSPRTTTRSVSTEQSSRGEECQTSTHDQGEQPDGRVHRRTRCRKRQRAADAPRFDGSVLPAYVEHSRYVCPAEPYRPSRLLMRHSGGLLYVPKDLWAAASARVAHALHMFTARVASEPGGRKCATARKSRLATPNFFNVHTPAHPVGVGVSTGELCGGHSGP
jgi:hypothetical protein